jgi:long-chain acyl-CoA synthetase
MVPTMINTLVHHARLADGDVSSLRLLIHGGAPIAEDLLVKAIRALGCSFTQVYGMTEAAPLLTALAREEDLIGDARLRSAGREVLGVDVRIVDREGRACKAREIGEVVARGPNLMLGYWGMPEETALALRDGWYWTGDLAYADEAGYIYVVDRSKDMIISGGENIYSAEVEASIMAHPDVLECAVIGIPDDNWGERVHAVVALQPDRDLTFEQLKAFCAERIAGYKCPKSLEVLPELPKSGAGKILKRDLRDRHWREHARQVH